MLIRQEEILAGNKSTLCRVEKLEQLIGYYRYSLTIKTRCTAEDITNAKRGDICRTPTRDFIVLGTNRKSVLQVSIYDNPIQPSQLGGSFKDIMKLCGIIVQNQILKFWELQDVKLELVPEPAACQRLELRQSDLIEHVSLLRLSCCLPFYISRLPFAKADSCILAFKLHQHQRKTI